MQVIKTVRLTLSVITIMLGACHVIACQSDSEDAPSTADATNANGDTADAGGDTGPIPKADIPCTADNCGVAGQFSIDWNENKSPALSIRHADDDTRTLWQSADDTPLVTAGQASNSITTSRGSFTFEINRDLSCQKSAITNLEEDETSVVVTGSFSDCELDFSITYTAESERRLRYALELMPKDRSAKYTQVSIGWQSDADEGFFGFGAQYNILNLKGRLLPIWCQEQGHGRGLEPLTETLNAVSPGSGGDWHTSYTCVPYFLSTNRYGMVIENSDYLEFDMEADTFTRVMALAPELTGQILYGENPMEIVETYTEYSGRMDPLPDWTQTGAIVRTHGGAEEAYDRVSELDNAGAALAALWVEDWAGTRDTPFGTRMWWNWTIDRTVYPKFEEMIKKLKDQGVRALIYFNPFLTDATEQPGVKRVLFKEAIENNYLVESNEGGPALVSNGGFDAGMVDLTNAKAREWLKQIMRDMIDTGVSGWMADFGEALPIEIKLSSGVDPTAYHNEYPFDWAKLNYEVATETGVRDDFLTFNRSGNARSPSVARSFWIGDQLVTWDEFDGFKTVIPAMLSSGLSGYTLQHGEVGGWLSINLGNLQYFRSKELFQRWMETSSFFALLRLHTTNLPELNHQYNTDEDTLTHFARMTQVFAALAPYRKSLMDEAATKGAPIVRHPMLHYPNDKAVYELMNQFMLGADFMVAPVLDEGATEVSLYLPAGSWTHLWSGKEYGDSEKGTDLTIDAPIGEPAVFFRSDSKWGKELHENLKKQGIL